MTYTEVKKLVKKYQGWFEGDVARFPSPYLKDKFLKDLNK